MSDTVATILWQWLTVRGDVAGAMRVAIALGLPACERQRLCDIRDQGRLFGSLYAYFARHGLWDFLDSIESRPIRQVAVRHLHPEHGESLLHVACEQGRVDVVDALLRYIDVNSTEAHGITPLMIAIFHNHPDVVARLLREPGVDMYACSRSYTTGNAFFVASRKSLLVGGLSALHLAAEYGTGDIIRLLLHAAPDLDVNMESHDSHHTPLILAAASDNMDALEALLEHPGIDVNAQRGLALQWAAWNGWTRPIERLLTVPGVYIRPDILTEPVRGGYEDVVASLLAYVPDDALHRALHDAVSMGRSSILRRVLETPGVDVNRRRGDSKTCLHIAADTHKDTPYLLDTLELLLSVPGLDINARDDRGWTPLMIACATGGIETVRKFLDIPTIDVYATTRTGNTAYTIALEHDALHVALLLVSLQ